MRLSDYQSGTLYYTRSFWSWSPSLRNRIRSSAQLRLPLGEKEITEAQHPPFKINSPPSGFPFRLYSCTTPLRCLLNLVAACIQPLSPAMSSIAYPSPTGFKMMFDRRTDRLHSVPYGAVLSAVIPPFARIRLPTLATQIGKGNTSCLQGLSHRRRQVYFTRILRAGGISNNPEVWP